MNSMSRRNFVAALLLMGVGLASTVHAQGKPPASASVTLFQNVRIFDGKSRGNTAATAVSDTFTVGRLESRVLGIGS